MNAGKLLLFMLAETSAVRILRLLYCHSCQGASATLPNCPHPQALIAMAHEEHVYALAHGLAAEERKATFACGGKLPLDPTQNDNVIVRFGPHGTGSKLSLPCKTEDPAFQQLIAACNPASFGLAGKDVFDETYRKATKLNTDDFCTDFCPYTLGLLNIVNQLLVPSIDEKRSVRAELYKLNVYSGPSGRFKAHVDTPRSEMQVGSLVVCLPSPFAGMTISIVQVGIELG